MNCVEINDINDPESLDLTWIPKIIKYKTGQYRCMRRCRTNNSASSSYKLKAIQQACIPSS